MQRHSQAPPNGFHYPRAPAHAQQQSTASTSTYHGYQPVAPNPYSRDADPSRGVPSNRRTPSVSTFASVGSTIAPPASYKANDLRRSVSSRSGSASPQPSSYVALLRKQKATVWCDRSQYEDPRVLAHFKAAKAKASMDLVGNGPAAQPPAASRTSASTGAGKLIGKVRHHSKTGNAAYTPDPNTYVGLGGVPVSFLATEVGGDDSDDEKAQASQRMHHRRTGSSGRGSNASARRANQYHSSGSLTKRPGSQGGTPERSGSMVSTPIGPEQVIDDRASGRANSTASGSSAERADAVADLGAGPKLATNSMMHQAVTREKSLRNPDDLKRRGSVDERTVTLTSGRLFIANPD